ncbi:molybdopterin-binding protein [Aquipuribacter nitratireducens]|uniref:Molybdopterin molybdenumtransferase n=1 Tax=Aquipuribacter nitratireducens TaxID=650104 RepID=A0ABW0GPK8_9MICO
MTGAAPGPFTVDEARSAARALGAARVPRHVPVALDRAHGRVLAVDVRDPTGHVVVPRGSRLGPLAVGAAAAAGADAVHVVVPPRVALLVTGDGLLAAGASRGGRTRDVLSHVLPDLLVALGGDLGPGEAGVASTGADGAAVLDAVAGPYRGTVDVLVTTGGTGGGAEDRLRGVLRRVRARLVVPGVDVEPGGSALVAAVPDGPLVVGLPGRPVAAVALGLLLAGPLLGGWLGVPDAGLAEVALAGQVTAGPWPRVLPARLDVAQGRVEARDPGAVGLAGATGVVVVGRGGAARWVPLPVAG